MKLKKEFLIKGHLWKVEYKWGLRSDGNLVDGLCERQERVIYLRRELSIEEKRRTFLHELIHAIISESHIITDESERESLIEEIFCEGVADVLDSLFTLRWKPKK